MTILRLRDRGVLLNAHLLPTIAFRSSLLDTRFFYSNKSSSIMPLETIVTLFFTLTILAALPSTSVITVVSRSIAGGFGHGIATSIGIVVADICFIIIAILGLSVVAKMMGDLFLWVKLCAGIYLIWFGIGLWRSVLVATKVDNNQQNSLISSFLCGLFITLGDQKAILFYLGFFPAFIDLNNISQTDIGIIIVVTIIAVGGVKVAYAFASNQASALLKNTTAKTMLNRFAGCAMLVTGGYLVITSIYKSLL
jgi:threonine/homoserine/homoserine lactone efflux protein